MGIFSEYDFELSCVDREDYAELNRIHEEYKLCRRTGECHVAESTTVQKIEMVSAPHNRKKKKDFLTRKQPKHNNTDIINFVRLICSTDSFAGSCKQIYTPITYTDKDGQAQTTMKLVCFFNKGNVEEVLSRVRFYKSRTYYITKNGFFADKLTDKNGNTALFTLDNIVIDLDNHSNTPKKAIDTEIDRLLYFLDNDYEGSLPDFTVARSGRGVQLWFKLDTMHRKMQWLVDVVTDRLCDVLRKIIKDNGIDLQVDLTASKGVTRLVRLPYTYNQHTHTKVTVERTADYRYTVDDLKEFFDLIPHEKPKKAENQPKKIFISKDTNPDYAGLNIKRLRFIEKIVTDCKGDVKGRRDGLLWVYYNYALAVTKSKEQALDMVLTLNSRFKEPQAESEVRNEVKSVNRVGYYKLTVSDFFEKISATLDERLDYSNTSNRQTERDLKRSAKEQRNIKALELYNQGYSQQEIADELGISLRTVKTLTATTSAKDKSERDTKVILLFNQGLKQSDIAEQVGTSLKTVKRIIKAYRESFALSTQKAKAI